MTIYKCINCNKEFNRKCNYDYHVENKKKPCSSTTNILPPISSDIPPISSVLPVNELNIFDLLFKKPTINEDNINKHLTCMYCEKVFTRVDNLQRHLAERCKSKATHDEMEDLKEKMKMILEDHENLKKNYENLINNNEHVRETKNNTTNKQTINNNNNSHNNNNNKINNGVINNINIVQFGQEDISKLNLPEAMKQYLISTGGNIASSMLKYINLNEKYPENHNICITDMSRELVKIHNGTKFVTKKFKNVKNDIMKNIVKNTRKMTDIYIKDDKIKKSDDTKTKIKINEVSLKLIDGISGEEIVREEIKEKEKLLKQKTSSKKDIDNSEDDDSESEEEIDFTFEERLRIEHLDKKREGLQIKTFENLKEELYNARESILKS